MMLLAKCTDEKSTNNSIVAIEQSLTVADSVLNSPLLMSEGKKPAAIKQIIKIIEFFLTVVGKQMEKFQIQVLAGDLYDAFWTDTIDDIILMFKMARKGDFGKIFKLDHFTIMEWVPQYMNVKSEERERLIQKAKEQRQKSKEDVPMSDEARQRFEELEKRLTTAQEKKRETFSINKALRSMDGYLETLPEASMKLSDADLRYELRKTENTNREAFVILSLELERRKQVKRAKNQEPKTKNRNADKNTALHRPKI